MITCLFCVNRNHNRTDSENSTIVIQEEPIETYDIQTEKGTFQYPTSWKENMRYEEKDNQIVFYGKVGNHEEQILFTLVFGGSEGYLLGKLNGEELHIIDSDVQFDESWSEEEKNQIITMQEDFNVILEDLLKNESFELASKKQ